MRVGLQSVAWIAVSLHPLVLGAGQLATVTVAPEADTFVRSAAPTSNYGGAGAISISGSAAVNATNQQNGLFDSLIRFPMSNVVSTLDATLGTHDWLVLSATLSLREMGAPPSPIFNRGVGAFEVRWIAADAWVEGTGIPVVPTTNGVTWNDVPSLLNPALDMALGQFTNAGVDGRLTFDLSPSQRFVSDVRSGGPVDLYLTAASPQVGFTALSRGFSSSSNDVPILSVVAAVNPNPRLDSIVLAGTNVAVGFKTVSNWLYVLQRSDSLEGVWANVAMVPAQPTNASSVFVEAVTGQRTFYRLSVSH